MNIDVIHTYFCAWKFLKKEGVDEHKKRREGQDVTASQLAMGQEGGGGSWGKAAGLGRNNISVANTLFLSCI